MKARLYKVGETYYLQKCNGDFERISRSFARHFLLHFSDSEYCVNTESPVDGANLYDGEVIAELVDNGFLLVKHADLFRTLVENSDVTLVSVKQFADLHGKSASMTRRHCQNGRIEGAILTPGGYIIPEDAAYPK